MGTRKIKKQVLALLNQPEFTSIRTQLNKLPTKAVVNALFPAICRSEEQLRWNAITAMGIYVARLAEEDMEEGRIIMRRMLWSLNDESGGIGWGAPESMAEIMSLQETFAREYAHMLISYMRHDGDEIWQDGNFLEHETLQQGLLWGAGRLAQTRRQLVLDKGMDEYVPFYLDSNDPTVRSLAARAIGLLGVSRHLDRLEELSIDDSLTRLFVDGKIQIITVGQLATQAMQRLED